MKGTIKRRLLAIVFALLTIFSISIVAVNAAVTMDGTIDEGDWNFWFKDDSEQPVVDVYWITDADYLYIGLVTDDANENKDVLEFAFRADGIDYWIQVKPDIAINYRPSGGDYNGWWDKKKSGLPSGVSIVAGETGGTRSYEISIDVSILNQKDTEKAVSPVIPVGISVNPSAGAPVTSKSQPFPCIPVILLGVFTAVRSLVP